MHSLPNTALGRLTRTTLSPLVRRANRILDSRSRLCALTAITPKSNSLVEIETFITAWWKAGMLNWHCRENTTKWARKTMAGRMTEPGPIVGKHLGGDECVQLRPAIYGHQSRRSLSNRRHECVIRDPALQLLAPGRGRIRCQAPDADLDLCNNLGDSLLSSTLSKAIRFSLRREWNTRTTWISSQRALCFFRSMIAAILQPFVSAMNSATYPGRNC